MNYTCVLPLDSVEMAFSRVSAAAKPHHSLHSSVELTHIELIWQVPIAGVWQRPSCWDRPAAVGTWPGPPFGT